MPSIRYDSTSIQTLFSGMNSGKSSMGMGGTNFLGINLADYASIRTGSYGKLLRSYYSEALDSSDKHTSNKVNTSTSTSKETAAELARTEEKAEALKESADKLLKKGTESVFEKKSGTDSEGNVTYGYDTDKIYKAVKNFTDKYNDLLDAAKGSKVSGVSSAVSSMERMTKINSDNLGKMGITIGEDNRLSIDEGKFKKADMNQVKSMFNSTGSYGYQVSAQASMVDYYAQNEASKANTYSKNAMFTYNYNNGSIYNSYM